ncbi:HDOD domain-containing protein [Flavobacterium sp. MXW15]|uniref:HDOD domain-containing protein n=1 Tax=Xanthomonas chitinilytica TaxID=2989819 RepID=A0ABT3JS23_9XANT|nr:HDOD domain-containing protein [Xanthomonas sp. H13-6]MCW4453673.1 HDOD domain-containing protein [Flavobacterium sp. MXW15]MCW4471276.1 HDOD domain-containing protein [Xanthomonas sp. H13-6]
MAGEGAGHENARAATAVEREQLRAVRQRLHVLALGSAPPLTLAERPAHEAVAAAVAATLVRIDMSPRYTPRRPQLLPQLMQSVNDADASARSIARIIGQDPVLVGNLLRIANSPLYRLQARPVESIERAVTLVGTDGIRQIISAALVQPVMNIGAGAFARFQAVVWEHSLLAGAAAADHARAVGREDGLAAQLLALLHGLAAVLVVQVLRDEYARQPLLKPSVEIAQSLLEEWTAATAERVAGCWELPESLRRALRPGTADGGSRESLARSLEFGQLAATLALLCRHGEMEAAAALATLDGMEAQAHATEWIWRRLTAPAPAAG